MDVISDCGIDLRVVGVCHCTKLLDGKGPGKHDEAGLFQSCHRGKREGADVHLRWEQNWGQTLHWRCAVPGHETASQGYSRGLTEVPRRTDAVP